MNNKFVEFRNKYPNFIYHKYEYYIENNNLNIKFYFEIPHLTEFNPTLNLKLKNTIDLDDNTLKSLIFHIGMIEAISYVKCTCSPNIIIKAGFLDKEQIEWFKKLYYYGLGEFLYTNGIDISLDELFDFQIEGEKLELEPNNFSFEGNLIPIGGGKDSVVTLELLKNEKHNDCFILNPKEANLKCACVAGYDNSNTITVNRTIDKRLLELNKQGFLNGHTPFSSLVAFITYLVAYIYKKKNIVLSNEASANEATVLGTKINHQYSKTYEFENDFNEYTSKYFNLDIKYFSMLRPLTEYQIGMLFSTYEKYHQVFKSCNVGSKDKTWNWCCNCPKCLFVFIILSPFLYKDKLVQMFGEDLFEREDLKETFVELLGYAQTKPFECVGTYSEVRYAVSRVIKTHDKLPYLLKFYKDNYPLELDMNYEISFNDIHNLDSHFISILKKELDYVSKNYRTIEK